MTDDSAVEIIYTYCLTLSESWQRIRGALENPAEISEVLAVLSQEASRISKVVHGVGAISVETEMAQALRWCVITVAGRLESAILKFHDGLLYHDQEVINSAFDDLDVADAEIEQFIRFVWERLLSDSFGRGSAPTAPKHRKCCA